QGCGSDKPHITSQWRLRDNGERRGRRKTHRGTVRRVPAAGRRDNGRRLRASQAFDGGQVESQQNGQGVEETTAATLEVLEHTRRENLHPAATLGRMVQK